MDHCRVCRQGFGLHLLTCPLATAPKTRAQPRDVPPARPRYSRPSRQRIPRADYLASVATSPEDKARMRREKQARYRARQKAKRDAG